MTHPRPTVLDYLTQRYASLKTLLTRRLGNPDLASDALHDTYLRLQGMDALPERERPGAFLVRVATNIALDIQRKDNHTVAGGEVELVLNQMADPGPGPEQAALARIDLERLTGLVDRMPERRRVIMVMVHWEGIPRNEVAKRLGISRRTLETELQRAHERLAEYFRDP
ncbi:MULTISPECIES: RNA polymerase sigma factor [Alcaligenaceae]|uniref:RNA polymerase sigma factor n=1 Tax=Alcaligenaceae TaxID=506 RepID=UPI002920E632|nr:MULTISPECIES: sigma-70 family RNA polymerase sigma factor [Alcaligenaceae]WPL82235.1 sigma-70 family RNA polymerase sigma factor [Bordetella hinzii]BEG77702.1 putative RNA polymerase sigma factor FecI [Achromobacter xylosoxidans]